MGQGVFPPEAVPALPHPRCQCWTTKKILPPSEWGKDRKLARPKKITKSGAEVTLFARSTPNGRKVTPSVVKGSTERANRAVAVARAEPIDTGIPA